ncbi:recombinase family protein [Falsiroseomonas sp. E2-1-a4]|uniref:recombinase family protein n=1 Tax=Falsiroseomonas sp. E2-1-a4 TaxID=3239299 RepID=UPI003F37EDE7
MDMKASRKTSLLAGTTTTGTPAGCAIYARYSDDGQNPNSIADQIRLCRTYAERQGWRVVEVHSDAAVSGAIRERPGYRALLDGMRAGRFEVVLAESLDRISRDQEHTAAFYKQAEFHDVVMFTVGEGKISPLHIGLKGTMGAIFLRDLADKTRRGQEGKVRAGRLVGRVPYGYDHVTRQMTAAGEVERGLVQPNPTRVAVVLRIFRDYAAGASPKAIAAALNAEDVPGPNGGTWSPETLRGKPDRGTGLLRNPIYAGRLVWNRQRSLRDPDTGKKARRRNPAEEVVGLNVPGLRIIDLALWEKVQARLDANRAPQEAGETRPRFWERRRPEYLLSGKVVCGICGRSYKAVGRDYFACAAARFGACTNGARVRRGPLETRVCEALGRELMDPEMAAEFARAFAEESNAGTASAEAARGEQRRELAGVERKVANLLNALEEGARGQGLAERLAGLETRREEIRASLAGPPPAPARLPPDLGVVYRARLSALREALAGEGAPEALEAARTLIARVVVMPPDGEGGPPGIELVGQFSAMLELGGAVLPGGILPEARAPGRPRSQSSVKGDHRGQSPSCRTPSQPPQHPADMCDLGVGQLREHG